jgi:hypothetical protein
VATYVITPMIVKRLDLDLVGARPCPNRDNDWYFLCPAKNGYDGTKRYAIAALTTVEPAAVIVADYSLWRPLLFMQRIEHVRPDVSVVFIEPLLPGDRILAFLHEQMQIRPVYFATNAPAEYYGLDRVYRDFRLEERTPVFRLRNR